VAGAGAKLFVSGDVLTAAQVNTFLQDQVIMRFATTTARDNAFGGVGEPTLAEGMFAYIDADNSIYYYTGSAWEVFSQPLENTVLGYRNVVINGAMQIAQRGTSTASITGGGYFTADRFYFNAVTMGTWTNSVENDAPTGSGFRKSFKMLCTTADASPAAGDRVYVEQAFEGQNLQQFLKGTASAKQFSMSFWVKSGTTGTYVVWLLDNDNTRSVSATYTVSAANTWEKKTITFPADTTGAFDNNNALSCLVRWYLGAGTDFTSGTLNTTWASVTNANTAVGQTNLAAATNNYWQVTGVQLEAGSVATPFEFEDYGETIRKCYRYFQHAQDAQVGGFRQTNQVQWVQNYRSEMRANPTVTLKNLTTHDLNDGDNLATSAIGVVTSQTNNSVWLFATVTNTGTVNGVAVVYADGSAPTGLYLDSEL